MTAGFFLCSGGGLKGKCEGSSSVGLDVVRSIPFGEEGLEAAKSHTEDTKERGRICSLLRKELTPVFRKG